MKFSSILIPHTIEPLRSVDPPLVNKSHKNYRNT